MDGAGVLIALVILLGLAFEFVNGFHDAANAIATVIATRVLTPLQALLMAGSLNLVGALAGTAVAATVAKGIVDSTRVTQDLVLAALEKAGTEDAVMIGDTPWDVEAARRAGIETICVVTGGFSVQELTDAGALAVYESVAELREQLNTTPLS